MVAVFCVILVIVSGQDELQSLLLGHSVGAAAAWQLPLLHGDGLVGELL